MRQRWGSRFLGGAAAIFGGMLIAIFAVQHVGITRSADSFATRLATELTRQQDVWCWRTICPSLSSVASAVYALATDAGDVQRRYGNLYWEATTEPVWAAAVQVITEPPVVFYIQLTPPQTEVAYTLADAMLEFGTPVNVQLERDLNDWVIFVCFEHGVCGGMQSQDLRLRATQPLSIINLSRSGINLSGTQRAPGLYGWRGLGRIRRR